MAETTTKKQALRAFRDALKEGLQDLGVPATLDSNAARIERVFAEALAWALQDAPAVSIPGLGTFRRTSRKARSISAPPGAEIGRYWGGDGRAWMDLPETHSVRFSPCGEWRRSLK